MVLLHAIRSLRCAPVYSLTLVLTIALGLTAVGAMFTVTYGVLIAPLPYDEPDRLVTLQLQMPDGVYVSHSPAISTTYERLATQLEDVALYRVASANVWGGSADADADAESLAAAWMTASTLTVLRVKPLLGRGFSEQEGLRGGAEAVILGEREWRTRFGAAPDVIGKRLVINDVSREIVGVMPAGFSFPAEDTRLWLPAKRSGAATAGEFIYHAIARLDEEATLDSAQQELGSLLPRMAEAFPRLESGGSTAEWLAQSRTTPRVRALRDTMTSDAASTLWILSGVAGLVLLVACANVASLVLIRVDAQRHDRAIREALGANSLRASAQLLAESVLLGAVAVVLAVLFSLGLIALLRELGPIGFPRLSELSLRPSTIASVTLVSLLGIAAIWAMIAGLIRSQQPSTWTSRDTRSQTGEPTQQRLRAGVTVVQIACALVVLTGAGALLRTAQRLHDVDPGFVADDVTTFRILLPFARYGDVARVDFYARLTERVSRHPLVEAAGLTSKLPLGRGSTPQQSFLVGGDERARTLAVNVTGDGYFSTLRIPLVAGRDFRSLDLQRAGEIVISRRAARILFADDGDAHAIGRTLALDPGGPVYTVVGVVGDVRHDDLATSPPAIVYRPQVVARQPATEPGPLPGMVLSVRSNAPQDVVVALVRGIVRELDPGIPVFEVDTLRDVVLKSTANVKLAGRVVASAAVVTLLLGTTGLYGVMAYLVALRTRELGLRMTLGADPFRIARWIMARGLVLTTIGLTIGLLAFGIAVSIVRAFTPAIIAWDPVAIIGAILVLVVTAALACAIPALRAAAIPPARALRAW